MLISCTAGHSVRPPPTLRRLVLAAAGEALAGAPSLHAAPAARTGVFVGISWTEYARLAADAGTGGPRSTSAGPHIASAEACRLGMAYAILFLSSMHAWLVMTPTSALCVLQP